jgi:hypothetical protein
VFQWFVSLEERRKKVPRDRDLAVTEELITKMTGLTAKDQRRLAKVGVWFELDSRSGEMITNYDSEDPEVCDLIIEIMERLAAEQAERDFVPVAWQTCTIHQMGHG